MNNSIAKSLLLLCLVSACSSRIEKRQRVLTDPYFGLQRSDSVQLLAPGIISSSLFEYNGTFSPKGSEFYYTVSLPGRGQVVFMELKEDNSWSTPSFAAFSSDYSEVDPLFSPDGSRLYFTSNRPIPGSTDPGRNNIWYVEKVGRQWGEPQFVGLTENGDYYSSLTRKGDIYFNTWKTGDIYKAVKTDSSHAVQRLPDIINLDKSVGDPFIAPDEQYLIFRGSNLENSIGGFDLFISFNIDGAWTAPMNLGEPINSKAREICPYVTTDGKLLIFASNRLVEDYRTKPLESIEAFKSKSESFDNGSWNIFYTSTSFIERLRSKLDSTNTSMSN